MSRWDHNDLATALAKNSAIRLNKSEGRRRPALAPVVAQKYYVVTRLEKAAPSMVHREGCSVLKRATHAKPWNRNPIAEDKFNNYEPYSCLSTEERKPPINLIIQNSTSTAKPRKYRNQPVDAEGVHFDSNKESLRFLELKILERHGKIQSLEIHPKYIFELNGVRIGSYKPDFRYVESGELVVEDCKSAPTKTQAYRLRKRMMRAFFGITILET